MDDHRLMLEGLSLALRGAFTIAGTLSDGTALVAECRRLKPDAVLLDLSLPDRSGLELIGDLREAVPDVKILMVTMHVDRVLADAALQAGAHGFVPKDAGAEDLKLAVRAILAGRQYVSALVPKHSRGRISEEAGYRLNLLTPRQREIVRLLGEGKSSARIAAELHLSINTVTFHRVRIRKALGIDSEWGLNRYALLACMSLKSSS